MRLAGAAVERTVLRNGLTVLVRRDDSAPVVAVVTYVCAGYFDEPDSTVGIAHVLEHMFFKGTPDLGVGEIAQLTRAAGGYLNAGTIYDRTSYYAVLPTSGFRRGLAIQADAYAHSIIDADELARELEVIIQEAKRKEDSAPAVTIESLYALLHDRHRIRRWRIGRPRELRTFTRDALLAFYRNFYRPANTILSIVGDIDPDETMHEVERLYGSLPGGEVVRSAGPAEPAHDEFRFRELAGDVGQTQLAIGWRTPGTLDPDTPTLDVAAAVLGTGRASRLYRALRERSLAVSVSAGNYTPTELGVFTVHAECPPTLTEDAARAAWAEVQALGTAAAGATDGEVRRTQTLLDARWVRRLESMEAQANHLAEWEALGGWQLGESYHEQLMAVTPATIGDVITRYLAPGRCGVVVYRPANAPPLAADAASLRALLERAPRPVSVGAAAARPAAGPAVIARPTLEREESGVRVYRTARGVPILVRVKRGAPLAHLGVFALGGACDEAAPHAGLTALLARTAVKGTRGRSASEIAAAAESMGGSIGASTGAESFGWTLSVPSRHLAGALDLLADVAQRPALGRDSLDIERAAAIADLALLRDDMYRYPMRLATEAAFRGHPYGVPATGTTSSLATIDETMLRDWHGRRFLEGPVAIAVVGELDPDAAAGVAAAVFADLTGGDPAPLSAPSWPEAPVQLAESREKAQTALALALPAPDREDDARFATDLITGVASGLGGRFFEELRSRQSLAYTVHAIASERRRAGMFVCYIATAPEREDVARAGLLAEIAKLRESPVSEAELTRAKEYAIGTHAICQQSGGAVLGEMLDAWLLGRSLDELAEHDERVRAVTPAAMQALAQRYFDPARMVEGIVRGSRSAANG